MVGLDNRGLRHIANYVGLGKADLGATVGRATKAQLIGAIDKTGFSGMVDNFNAAAVSRSMSPTPSMPIPSAGSIKYSAPRRPQTGPTGGRSRVAPFTGPISPFTGPRQGAAGSLFTGPVRPDGWKPPSRGWSGGVQDFLNNPKLGGKMKAFAGIGAIGGATGSIAGGLSGFVSPENFSQDRSTFSNVLRGAAMGASLGAINVATKGRKFTGGYAPFLNKATKMTHNVSESGVTKGALFAAGLYGGANVHLTRPHNPIK